MARSRTPLLALAVVAAALLPLSGRALASTHAHGHGHGHAHGHAHRHAHAHRHRHEQRAVGACSAAHAAVRRGTVRQARIATLCLLNRVRAEHGLRPLRPNARLARAARSHSRDMVRRHYFAHDSLNGVSPFDRMRATHYVPPASSWWLGENIGWGSGSLGQPIALVRAWMHSPPHRENILSRHFRDIGIGIAPGAPTGGGGATYTTDFGAHS